MNPNTIYDFAELYDACFPTADVDELAYYLRQAERYGTQVLELACGSGRLTVPLAASGLQMAGLDMNPNMLALATAKAGQAGLHIDLRLGDMRDFHFGRHFDLIFIPVNSIAHLFTRQDIEACFACVREHLAPHGRFLIDIFNPSLTILSRDETLWYTVGDYQDAQGHAVRLVERNHYDSAVEMNYIIWRAEWADRPAQEFSLTMRQFFPQELDALLTYNGFAIDAKYGSLAEEPFDAAARQQLVVAKIAG